MLFTSTGCGAGLLPSPANGVCRHSWAQALPAVARQRPHPHQLLTCSLQSIYLATNPFLLPRELTVGRGIAPLLGTHLPSSWLPLLEPNLYKHLLVAAHLLESQMQP